MPAFSFHPSAFRTFLGARRLQNVVHGTVLSVVIYREMNSFFRYGQKVNRRTDNAYFVVLSNREIVKEYFKLISEKDVRGLLQLFDEGAVVYEPFSNIKSGLHDKTMIENLLGVAVMTNTGFRRTIRFVDESEDKITAIVTFERGKPIAKACRWEKG